MSWARRGQGGRLLGGRRGWRLADGWVVPASAVPFMGAQTLPPWARAVGVKPSRAGPWYPKDADATALALWAGARSGFGVRENAPPQGGGPSTGGLTAGIGVVLFPQVAGSSACIRRLIFPVAAAGVGAVASVAAMRSSLSCAGPGGRSQARRRRLRASAFLMATSLLVAIVFHGFEGEGGGFTRAS